MKKEKCTACGTELPIRELVFVDRGLFCRPCALKKTAPGGGAEGQKIQDAVDPTICDRCGADNGAAELPRFKELPYCPACMGKVRGRRLWPAALGVLVVIVLAGAAVMGIIHMRTVAAARDAIDQSIETYKKTKNIDSCLAIAQRAFEKAPEDSRVKNFYYYFSGMKAMYAGDNQHAAALFNSIDPAADANTWGDEETWGLQFHRRNAQMNLAFDQKRYEDALDLAREALKKNPGDPMLMCQVASFCAAVWAEKKDYKMKNEALDYIKKVKSFLPEASEAERKQMNYQIERVQYRIDSRQILSRKEHEAKFGPPPK